MLSNMDRLLMQSAADAQRICDLGGLHEPGRVTVLGNSKFDQEVTRFTPEQVSALRARLRLPDGAPTFVAGSTRSAEEEAEVVRAYTLICREHPTLCLVIAPRKIERASEVVEALKAAGLQPVRRTLIEGVVPPVRHLVLDTMGELADVYAVADIAFVGNSFPPVVKGGGQNPLQPLAHGKPVLVGPFTATIRSEIALATETHVAFVVEDAAALAAEGIRLLHDTGLRQEIAARAKELIAANQGVSRRYAEEISRAW
jgi:3-deoxy-D-manno-octulosonic-acid transferase